MLLVDDILTPVHMYWNVYCRPQICDDLSPWLPTLCQYHGPPLSPAGKISFVTSLWVLGGVAGIRVAPSH